MNAHVGPAQTLKFRAQSLLAYVLEPVQPLADWFTALDALARPLSDLLHREARHSRHGGARHHAQGISRPLERPRAAPHPGHGRGERRPRVGRPAPASGRFRGAADRSADAAGGCARQSERKSSPAVAQAAAEKTESLIVDGNVRSGQTIMHPQGDVTIIGRVASGAEIVAGGSVHIYGALQGRVIAGISGSRSARIFCTEARAELLCIGGAYVTAENTSRAWKAALSRRGSMVTNSNSKS